MNLMVAKTLVAWLSVTTVVFAVEVTDTHILTDHDRVPRFSKLDPSGNHLEISQDTTLFGENVYETVTVLQGATLTLADGCTLTIQGSLKPNIDPKQHGVGLIVFGRLQAAGSAPGRIVVKSGDGDGDRGHIIIIGEGTADIENVDIIRMGRTTVEPVGPTNQIGRYSLHFHMLGNAGAQRVVGVRVTQPRKWGIVVHNTNLAAVENCTVVGDGDNTGAGIVTEGGKEHSNRFVGNTVSDCRGSGFGEFHPPHRQVNDFGHGGYGFWFHSATYSTIENNTATRCNKGFTIQSSPKASIVGPSFTFVFPDGTSQKLHLKDQLPLSFAGNTAEDCVKGYELWEGSIPTLERCTFRRCGNGVRYESTSACELVDCTIDSCEWGIHSASAYSRKLRMRGGSITNCGKATSVFWDGLEVSGVRFAGNEFNWYGQGEGLKQGDYRFSDCEFADGHKLRADWSREDATGTDVTRALRCELNRILLNNLEVFLAEQHRDRLAADVLGFWPRSLPAMTVGQAWDRYRIAPRGQVIPAGATPADEWPNISGDCYAIEWPDGPPEDAITDYYALVDSPRTSEAVDGRVSWVIGGNGPRQTAANIYVGDSAVASAYRVNSPRAIDLSGETRLTVVPFRGGAAETIMFDETEKLKADLAVLEQQISTLQVALANSEAHARSTFDDIWTAAINGEAFNGLSQNLQQIFEDAASLSADIRSMQDQAQILRDKLGRQTTNGPTTFATP